MRLTIGIPIYNSEKYLSRCLKSVLDSEGADEYEIICIDDGSTDRSSTVIQNYKNKHKQIRIIHSENKGAFIARSKIIDEAQGEWIGFVDSDDTVEKSMYKKLLDKTEKNNHIDMVVCAFNKIDCNTGQIKAVQMNSYGNKELDFIECPYERGMLAGINPAYWNKIYRKEKLSERLRLGYSPKIMEDYLFAGSIYPFVDGVAFVEKALYNYYDTALSATKIIGRKELNDAKLGLKELVAFLNSKDEFVSDPYRHDLIAVMTCVHLGIAFTINYNQYNGNEKVKDIWRETKCFLNENLRGWESNIYINHSYVRGRKELYKLYYASLLYKYSIWNILVKGYHLLCVFLGMDLKW